MGTYGDDTVEDYTIVIATFRELCKVFASLLVSTPHVECLPARAAKGGTYARGVIPVELELDVSQTGLENDRLHSCDPEEGMTESNDSVGMRAVNARTGMDERE